VGSPLDNVSLKDIPTILPALSLPEQEKLLAELEKLEELKKQKLAQGRFLSFVQQMWPSFIGGRHHARMADAFERVANGTCKRLIINMPPRHTKSEFASYLLPAWFLGKFPEKKVIQTSHTAELAVGFGRKVRNLVDTEVYHKTFPELALQADSKAAGRWNTSKGGDYFAIGVGGAVTGKGADLLIIDDPHSEQEAAIAETNPEVYDKVYEWYTSGPRQRLQPGGAIVIVMCMTGDTGVLRPDGSETPLRDIRPGDEVATYENGAITTAKVRNHRSSGVDSVFTIQTQSGKILRANEEHPFLVEYNGVRKWARVRDLLPGMHLVSTKVAAGPQELRLNRGCATPVRPITPIIRNTPMPRTALWAGMGRIRGRAARSATAISQLTATPCVYSTITKPTGLLGSTSNPPLTHVKLALNPATASLLMITTSWLQRSMACARSVASRLVQRIPGRTGVVSFVSIIATIPARFVGSFVTTVISRLGTEKPQKPCAAPLNTYKNTPDRIVSIAPSGVEEVFDVEVERTENFIANGVVSHNTRWSMRDLTAQVLKAAAQRGGEEWEVIELPAILPSGNPLWPEFWSLEELNALKEELPNPKWMAQYQQNPTSESSAIVKRDWWRVWESETAPPCNFILMSWDTAFEKSNRADYSALTTWGVFYHDNSQTGKPEANIILLNAFRERMEFPQLKQTAIDQYKEWKPDGVIIEKKASGAPLIYEMRAMGIPVQEFTPSKGNDKISRLNAVSDLFASGRVWCPNTHWAEEVVEEVASFPGGEHDDYVDSVSLALMRFRKGGYVQSDLDESDPPKLFKSSRGRGYY
jgi:predicted phage terminase large subunit-like protein